MKKTNFLLAALLTMSINGIAQPNYWGNTSGIPTSIKAFTGDNVGIGDPAATAPPTDANLHLYHYYCGTSTPTFPEFKIDRTYNTLCPVPWITPPNIAEFTVKTVGGSTTSKLVDVFDANGWLGINPPTTGWGAGGNAKLRISGNGGSGQGEVIIDRIGTGTDNYLAIYSTPPGVGSTRALKDVIDNRGWLGINTKDGAVLEQALDVSGNAHIGGGLIDMGMGTTADASGRTITANTTYGMLTLEGGPGGAGMSMFGTGRSDRAGSIGFSSAGQLVSTALTGPNGFMYYWYGSVGGGSPTWYNLMHIWNDGKVTIGGDLDAWVENSTGMTPDGYKLFVSGGILTDKLKVAMHTDPANWSDFVFAKDYNLMPLNKVESFIKANKHLPEIPSAQDVSDNGIDVASMDAKLLQKIEELTLYVIKQQKEIDNLKKKVH